jgi:hypothetical protein
MKKVVVYGFYNTHQNLGDELFKLAFYRLFPKCEVLFTDVISPKLKADVLVFGGGSFLDSPIISEHHTDSAKAPTYAEGIFGNGLGCSNCATVCYIGVGGETEINQDHEILLRHAKLVALRSDVKLDVISKLCSNTFVIPDLVYSLAPKDYVAKTPTPKRVLLCPNINTVPKYDDPHWKHQAWQHFKFEFAQALDHLITEGYSIDYLPMSTHREQLDAHAMVEIQNLMKKGHLLTCKDAPFPNYPLNQTDLAPLINLFGSYETIITQRFHGAVLSELARRPYLSLVHHDKLASTSLNEGLFRSYYAVSKTTLIRDFLAAQTKSPPPLLPLNQAAFDPLKTALDLLLK